MEAPAQGGGAGVGAEAGLLQVGDGLGPGGVLAGRACCSLPAGRERERDKGEKEEEEEITDMWAPHVS